MAIGNFPILIPDFMRTGVPPDPSQFVPKGDPFAELELLLNNLQNRTFVAPPQQNLAQRILNPIAEGAAILASPDSGGALSNILQGRQKRTDDFTKLNAEIQNNLMVAKIQSAIEKARSISAEQSEFRKEERTKIANKQAGKQELELFKGKEKIRQGTEFDIAIQNEQIAELYKEQRKARLKDSTLIQNLPDQFKEARKYYLDTVSLLDNVDPAVAKTLSEKRAGINPDPPTPQELKLEVDRNKKVKEQEDIQFRLSNAKTEAEINRLNAEAAASKANMGNRLNDQLFLLAAKKSIEQFYENPNSPGVFLATSELPTNIIQRLEWKPLPPDKNKEQQLKARQELEMLQRNINLIDTVPDPTPVTPVTEALRTKVIQDLQIKTKEQLVKEIGADVKMSPPNKLLLINIINEEAAKIKPPAVQTNPAFESTRKLLGIEDKGTKSVYNNTSAASAIYGNTSAESRTRTGELLETYKKLYPDVKDYTDLVRKVNERRNKK